MLYIVGKVNPENYLEWSFMGIFSTEELAVESCITCEHFVGPVELDVALPQDKIIWDGAYYPMMYQERYENNS